MSAKTLLHQQLSVSGNKQSLQRVKRPRLLHDLLQWITLGGFPRLTCLCFDWFFSLGEGKSGKACDQGAGKCNGENRFHDALFIAGRWQLLAQYGQRDICINDSNRKITGSLIAPPARRRVSGPSLWKAAPYGHADARRSAAQFGVERSGPENPHPAFPNAILG